MEDFNSSYYGSFSNIYYQAGNIMCLSLTILIFNLNSDPVISKSEPISRGAVIDGERVNMPSITVHVNVSLEKQTPGKTEGPQFQQRAV
jgi:hypothetical protein